jgi:hypothetical protein
VRARQFLLGAVLAACLAASGSAALMVGPRSREFAAHDDQLAHQYSEIVAALAMLDPPSVDWRLPGSPEGSRSALPALRANLKTLSRGLKTLADSNRAVDLNRHVVALEARLEQLDGIRLGYDDQMTRLFGSPSLPPSDGRRAADVRGQLDRLLPGSGPLSGRLAAYERAFIVPAHRLEAVIARAVSGCRDETGVRLALPPGESLSIVTVTGQPWSAFSQYLGAYRSELRVNASLPLTIDRALTVACHEGYPGHHAINSLREQALVVEHGRAEHAAQLTFSPSGFAAEALASAAGAFAFTFEHRVRFVRDELLPLSALDLTLESVERHVLVAALVRELEPEIWSALRCYLRGECSRTEAAIALTSDALMEEPDRMLGFADAYGAYAMAYVVGPQVLGQSADPWRGFMELVREPIPPLGREPVRTVTR